MDEHVNLFGRQIEEPARFDHLEPLVHQRRRIDRVLHAHLPGRMFERVGHGGVAHLVFRARPKRAAGRGEHDAGDPFVRLAVDTLEDRAVFAIDRQQTRTTRLRVTEQELAGRDDQFFVGHGNVDAGVDGGKHRVECHRAVGRCEQDVGFRIDGHRAQSVRTVGRRRRDVRPEVRNLFGEQVDVTSCGQAHDFETLRMAPDHVEGLPSDAPGRTEYRDPFPFHVSSFCATSRTSRAGSPGRRKARNRTRCRRKYTNRNGRGRRHARRSGCRRPSRGHHA